MSGHSLRNPNRLGRRNPKLLVCLWSLAGFDSHFSSVGKEYCYKLNCGVPQPMQV
jgi:hypothetical protein